ncbi:hypothetical protein A2276_04700 [candidate division WOR-1 bacterium RIFOXYA12_FULL_43_27]|nr:MAG: hypothetical protein A2276_04700 [candidate division WOR-1 bacterium RIFOXYA12_FULL_43_27]OGC18876.1 MAG: hypothetical protein A2292_08135 [candidate division WOR-1 bacterium RIFOXYB2_FULL_46_45]OGC29017.1 MAG: hypothetical protein A2232_03200 [candidate division WOR-1 bacterium RIFOXYA2_FULL_46_56]
MTNDKIPNPNESGKFKYLKILGFIGILILGFWIFPQVAYAFTDLSEIGIGARPLALGKAYAALSSDGSGIFTNPAGLSDFPKLKIVSMMGRLMEDVNYLSLGIADTFPFGSLGFGYMSAGLQSIPLTTLTHTPTGDVISDPYAYTDYTSGIYYLSYSRKFNPVFALGLNLKYFVQTFSLNSGAMAGAAGTGMEADLGLKWKPRGFLSIGCLAKNALPTSMGGKFTWQKNNREEGMPLLVNLGAYLKLFGASGFRQFNNQNVSVMAELQNYPNLSRPLLFKLGSEWWVTRGFALRLGIDQDYKATESGGTGIDSNITCGVGLKAAGFTFDYAYHQFGEIKSNTSHFFSIGYIGYDEDFRDDLRIGEKDKGGLFPILKKKPRLKQFTDINSYYWAAEPIEYFATLGIIDGYPDRTFRPDDAITRGQLNAVLARAKGLTVATKEASRSKDQVLTRGEAVIIFAKFAGLNPPTAAAAKKAGFLEYLGTADFNPGKIFTRAEAAEILSKTKKGQEKIREFLKE